VFMGVSAGLASGWRAFGLLGRHVIDCRKALYNALAAVIACRLIRVRKQPTITSSHK